LALPIPSWRADQPNPIQCRANRRRGPNRCTWAAGSSCTAAWTACLIADQNFSTRSRRASSRNSRTISRKARISAPYPPCNVRACASRAAAVGGRAHRPWGAHAAWWRGLAALAGSARSGPPVARLRTAASARQKWCSQATMAVRCSSAWRSLPKDDLSLLLMRPLLPHGHRRKPVPHPASWTPSWTMRRA
jgi:hypothetical protein